MRMDMPRIIEHGFAHSIGVHVSPSESLAALRDTVPALRALEVSFSKTVSYRGGN